MFGRGIDLDQHSNCPKTPLRIFFCGLYLRLISIVVLQFLEKSLRHSTHKESNKLWSKRLRSGRSLGANLKGTKSITPPFLIFGRLLSPRKSSCVSERIFQSFEQSSFLSHVSVILRMVFGPRSVAKHFN